MRVFTYFIARCYPDIVDYIIKHRLDYNRCRALLKPETVELYVGGGPVLRLGDWHLLPESDEICTLLRQRGATFKDVRLD